MRRLTLGILAPLALLAAAQPAHAEVLRFSGQARIDLHEVLVHGDPGTLDTSVVDLTIDLVGPRVPTQSATAAGVALIRPLGGSVTSVPLQGQMAPPEGSGGYLYASGLGEDGNIYCFRIWDQVDAPTPRADRLVAAFEPLSRALEGYVAEVGEDPSRAGYIALLASDLCLAMEYLYAPPISGDFSFSTLA